MGNLGLNDFKLNESELYYLRETLEQDSITESCVDKMATPKEMDVETKAEYAFLLGKAYEKLNANIKAKNQYHLAFVTFKNLDSGRKAIQAFFKFISISGKINPKKNLVFDYESLAERAINLGAFDIAGTCFLYISRELYSLGSLDLAMKNINKALMQLERAGKCEVFYSAVIHRCNLFLDLGNIEQAKLDFDVASKTQVAHLRKSLGEIEIKLSTKQRLDYLDPIWKDKLQKKNQKIKHSRNKLTKTELKLIEFLSENPSDRYTLMDHLYGNVEFDSAYARFRTLLTRLNKKRPGLVVKEGELFKITGNESVLHSLLQFKVS